MTLRREAPRSSADLNPRTDTPLDFPNKDLEDMTAADYDTLGFICGLEVHQQLHTRSKLFCRCPAGVVAQRVDAEVLRHMRPTLSELGEYDGTALMEFKTKKEIIYRLERGSVCTYEIDDTPPFPIDQEAVSHAVKVSQLFGSSVVSELHVMRKQYLDGSIPTGFQRTAMVALGGEIPFADSELGNDRVVRIRQLSLEEDSCREVSDVGHDIVFRTDRLGMPLVETVTEPDLLTPGDVRRGAELLARVARASGVVRRGAGAARQDVNVSIAGGRRVEIKGVCSHRALPRLVHVEAIRQLELLRIRAQLKERGLTEDMLADPAPGLPWETSELVFDARSVLAKSDFVPVADALEAGATMCAIRLPKFRHLLAHRTQPGMTFAREIADRLRVIACLTGRPFMIHSDLVDYGLRGSRWAQLRNATHTDSADNSDQGDALVVVWGSEEDVATAAREIIIRARDALAGVPAETRQAHADGTTGFERILPGAERMYPDTDTPPVPLASDRVAAIEATLPMRPWQREAELRQRGLSAHAARRLLNAPWIDLFESLTPDDPDAARRLAAGLEKRIPQVWRERGTRSVPTPDRLSPLMALLTPVGPRVHVFEDVLLTVLRDDDANAGALILAIPNGTELLSAAVEYARDRRAELRSHKPAAMLRWAMGVAMKQYRGGIDPLELRRALAQALEIEQSPESAQ